jgi:N-acetylmuramoyl-L-alanine amidase
MKYLKVFTLSLFFLLVGNTFAQNAKFKVTLDAGHGDHDPGARYNGHVEKEINLELVLKIGALLEQHSDIKVIYTRKTDVFIDLVERANIANKNSSDIFVSVHCNANAKESAYGTETFVMGLTKNASNLEAAKKENAVITLEKNYKQKYEGFDPNKPESFIGMTLMQEEFLENSINLAGKIENQFKNNLGLKSRGVHQAPFMVLHKAYMPRVLIETGFISNVAEGKRLDSNEGQQDVARAIANAIISYKKDYFDSGDETVAPVKKVDTTIKPQTEIKSNVNSNNDKAYFKIQISASKKNIPLKPANFKGLKYVTYYFDTLYKYYYGQTFDYQEAQSLLEEAKSKGYKNAFICAFKDGKSISIDEALKQ